MRKPRKNYAGQSIIEYVVLFAVVISAALIYFLPNIYGIFERYIAQSTGAMQ